MSMRKALTAVCCLSHLGLVVDAVQLPIRRHVLPSSFFSPPLGLSSEQITLRESRLPVSRRHVIYFTVPLSAGTPPQNFSVIPGLDWDGTCLPSEQCELPDCLKRHRYSHDASTTYKEPADVAQLFRMDFPEVYTLGVAAEDTLAIGGINIAHQRFEEALSMSRTLSESPNDGILGLARNPFTDVLSNFTSINPLRNLVKQRALLWNGLVFRLPRDSHGEGAMFIGEMPDDMRESEVAFMQMTNADNDDIFAHRFLAPGWQVAARSISVTPSHGHDDPMYANISGYNAAFSTLFPDITIPYRFHEDMMRRLNLDFSFLVPCEQRDTFPNITFSLGGEDEAAQDFVITPWDYLREEPLFADRPGLCEFILAARDEGQKTIVLGTSFLQRFTSVFDIDNGRIGLRHPRQ